MEVSGKLQLDPAAGSDEATAESEEAVLVARARQGDEAAWTALVRCHHEPVFRLAYLMLGKEREPAAAAEDLAQETFVRAYLKLAQFEDGRPLRPWLLAIAANLARNRRRSAGRYWAAIQRWWQAQVTEKATVQPAVETGENAQLLWQAIQRLPETQRQALYLRYFLNMPEAEMAQTLDVAQGTVKSRLYRAREALQAVLKEDYPILYDEWRQE
jgi:RNA polymerase sigma-70 factor (ECF subfamily)